VWKHAHIAQVDLLSPTECGWKLDSNGRLAIDWTSEDVLPQQVIDILAATDQQSASQSGEGMQEMQADEEYHQEYELVEEDELDNIIDLIFDEEDDLIE
jgi:hypothetical protein